MLLVTQEGAALSIGMIKNVNVNELEVRYLALLCTLSTPQTVLAVGLEIVSLDHEDCHSSFNIRLRCKRYKKSK